MPLSTMHRQESKIPGCLRASSALSQSRVETFEATRLQTPPCPRPPHAVREKDDAKPKGHKTHVYI